MRTEKEIEDLIQELKHEAITTPKTDEKRKTAMLMGMSVLEWALNKRDIKTFSDIDKDPKAWNDWIKNALEPKQ